MCTPRPAVGQLTPTMLRAAFEADTGSGRITLQQTAPGSVQGGHRLGRHGTARSERLASSQGRQRNHSKRRAAPPAPGACTPGREKCNSSCRRTPLSTWTPTPAPAPFRSINRTQCRVRSDARGTRQGGRRRRAGRSGNWIGRYSDPVAVVSLPSSVVKIPSRRRTTDD